MKLKTFLKYIEMNLGDECWQWKGSVYRSGYGQINHTVAHRVSYEMFVMPIPQGMCVCHHCDNKLCVRPSHLFLGTYKDNMQDAKRKGRMASGERHGSKIHPETVPRGHRHGRYTKPERTARGERNGKYTKPGRSARGERVNTAKITWEVAELIRQSTERSALLAARYGLSYSTVRRIKIGKYWKKEYAPCAQS